jgi:hypothetical protein
MEMCLTSGAMGLLTGPHLLENEMVNILPITLTIAMQLIATEGSVGHA